MSARKKWATSSAEHPGHGQRKRHSSEPAVYRWLKKEAGRWDRQEILDPPFVTVWVDEGDGQGWQTFERVDLRQVRR